MTFQYNLPLSKMRDTGQLAHVHLEEKLLYKMLRDLYSVTCIKSTVWLLHCYHVNALTEFGFVSVR